MMKQKLIGALLALAILAPYTSSADEGMWLPMFVKRLNYEDMQKRGLALSPEEIYDVNNSSLKDAIVRLGGGFCTGEIISPKGLMLTNHHCGYGVIQEKSSVKNDYLTDGFWAMSLKEELPAGFSVSLLEYMEDVSDEMNSVLNESMTLEERTKAIQEKASELEKKAVGDTKLQAQVKSFFSGNEFYIFVYKVYPDVRLVGAPPSAIGKFGGDTDNWMWPRHTGDFTMFRIYAGPDNEPAEYSTENRPFKPKHFLPISLDGVQQEDYAMIFGYPGSTDRFLTSHGVKRAIETEQPARVKLRRQKLDIYEEYMNTDKSIHIQYASKHARVSNYWKYFIGQTQGLKRLKVYDQKLAEENKFSAWISENPERKQLYGDVISNYEKGYAKMDDFNLAKVYLQEAIFGIEAISFSRMFASYNEALLSKNTEQIAVLSETLKSRTEAHFKDYHKPIDVKVMAEMLSAYFNDIPTEYHPEGFAKLVSKNKGDFNKLANALMSKSIFTDKNKTISFINSPSAKKLAKDPVYALANDFSNLYRNVINSKDKEASEFLEKADRLFVKGLREMNSNKTYYPNANSTMRVTYGRVLDYYPADATYYNYFTTIDGIMEKEDPNNPEFVVPEKLKELWKAKDYGDWADANGNLVVGFISDNDITGGNSGSPVINAQGHLIGTAFDGNWEAMSGDIAFEHNLQRTISVDIRYVLFIVDKYAGAKHLIEEMKLVRTR